MPYMGGVVHIIIALYFAVHVVRTGQDRYWLYILLLFPFLGSVVYFFAVYLPESRLHHGVRQVAGAAAKVLDPGREMREAERAYDMAPTAQNQMRLAHAYLEAGNHAQAAQQYEACLKGPFANDPQIRADAARARMLNGQYGEAQELLVAIRQHSPDFRPEQVGLLMAKCLAQLGRNQEAEDEFVSVTHRFGSVESRAEYAIWALGRGQMDVARAQYGEIERAMKYWNKYTRTLHAELMRRLQAAFAEASKS